MSTLYVLCFLSVLLHIQGCPNGAIQSDSSPFCYRYFAVPSSFSDAEDTCKQYYGHLASITNSFINSFVKETLNFISADISNPTWIGGFLNESNWTWTDGQPFNYKNWGKGEPSNNNCIGFQSSTGVWYTRDCSNLFPFLCEVPNDSTTPPPPTTPPQIHYCDDSWTYYHKTDSCYRVFYNQTWINSEKVCVGYNAHLTSVHSLEENLFISDLAKSGVYWTNCIKNINGINYVYCCTWIGLYYNTANESWIWSDGTPFDYQAWGLAQPMAGSLYAHVISDESLDSLNYFQRWGNGGGQEQINRNYVCKKDSNKS